MRAAALVFAIMLVGCNDSVVANFNAPTSIPASPTGVQNAFVGILNTSRGDVVNYVQVMGAFARDATQFQSTEGAFNTELIGSQPIANNDFLGVSIWDNEFRNAKTVNDLLTTLPKVAPAYTAAQIAALRGAAQTIKALNFMWVAETHDTLGVPVAGITLPGTQTAPILCNRDVWRYIVTLLDSAGSDLVAGGSTPLPVTLPSGFAQVSATASTFLGLNRALAGKAGLEYAYAIARPPDSNSVGVTDPLAQLALGRADSAIQASILYDPTMLKPGGVNEPLGVYHNFSSASGDAVNPIASTLSTMYFLDNFATDYDPSDARIQAKLALNTNTNGQPAYAKLILPGGLPDTGFVYGPYSSVNAPIPIIRNEELVLLRAQIHIAQQDWATAVAMLNAVRITVGGKTMYPATLTGYIPVREALLHEQRLSTVYEMGGDRTISIRFYGLAASRLTNIDNTTGTIVTPDSHPTVLPIPTGEVSSRNGNLTLACP